MRKGFLFLCLTLMLQGVAVGQPSRRPEHKAGSEPQRVGLVLSGGGAKGIAEMGAIQALEENDIPIDYVAGTSMGAIVGGLYAAGYSPQEMLELVTSRRFMDASTGTIDSKYDYYFFKPEARPSLFSVSFGGDSLHRTKILPSSLISPMPMNFQFMSIFSGYTAQCGGDFDRLFVPLRTVASDMTRHRKVVFSKGRLDDAVRASMSFPIVFKPVAIDGSLLYDGGIYDNFPVGVMRDDFDPDIIIGIDIHSTDTVRGFPDILKQMDLLVIRPTSSYEVPADEGIKMRIDLNRFGLLDFTKAKEIYDIGYRHALTMVDSIKTRIHTRRPAAEVARRREEFRRQTPPVIFDSVSVTGATPSENSYIAYQFQTHPTDTFGLDRAMDSYTKVISTGKMRDLDPMAAYNASTGLYSLALRADVKEQFDLGMGGYVTSSVNSMLFASLGYRSLSFRTIDASLNAWLGQSYMAGELNTRAILRHGQESAIGFRAVIWRQKFYENDKLFYEDDSPAFITNVEGFMRLKYSRATSRHGQFDVGIGYGHTIDRFYNNDVTILDGAERNKSVQDLGQLSATWVYTTLNDPVYPTSGRYIGALAQGIWGRYRFDEGVSPAREAPHYISDHDKWLQAEIRYRDYFALSPKMSLGIESTVLASTRHLIPNYNAALVNAPAFNPTPESYNAFNPDLRANSFITAGIVPVWKISDRMMLRADLHAFVPFRSLRQGEDLMTDYTRWFGRMSAYCQLTAVMKLPVGNLSAYCNYQTIPGDKWSVGISFGYFILAPRFMRL